MDDLQSISIKHIQGEKVKVDNPTNYLLIGKGKQGAVFKYSQNRCVKIFASQKHFEQERDTYTRTQGSAIIPKLYEVGSNYIIMEYIEGPTLQEYLKKKRAISKTLIKQILSMFHEMRRLEFTRLNVRLKHVIVTSKHGLKVIDHVNSFQLNEPKPILLFNELRKSGLLNSFLRQVKEIDKKTYLEWKESMREYFK